MFVPVVFISGAAKSLFTPLAMAVVFAMMTSYLLSRTLVPTMVHYLLAREVELYGGQPEAGEEHVPVKRNAIWRFHEAFDRQFDKLRDFYGHCLAWALGNRATVLAVFLVFVALSAALFPMIGRDFFPSVDSGQIRMHVRAPAGTRIEETERYFAKVAEVIRQVIPPKEVKTLIDNIGIPNSGINLSLSDGSLMSAADGEILVTLTEAPSADARLCPGASQGVERQVSRPDVLLLAARHRHASAQLRPAGADRRAIGRSARKSWKRTSRSLSSFATGLRRFPAPSMPICSRCR